ncbi:hypothetical protein QP809_06790, partial [Granulicatella sp. UMB5615B]|uniref:hypothetical protein n=1 Tax=Granulicatella sp. UMB5615B TaxID=3050602 RepID=UPI002557C2F2
GFHPRVSNSHWLLSPNAVVIKSASFSWFVKFKFFCKKVKCEKARCYEVLSERWRKWVGAGDESLRLENVIGTVFLKKQTLLA